MSQRSPEILPSQARSFAAQPVKKKSAGTASIQAADTT
jgi:hypothetical protein